MRCQSELPSGSGYCVACGFQNDDMLAKKGSVEIANRERVEKAKAKRGVYRFLRVFFRFFR